MKSKIRILHVDDSIHDRILVQDALEKEHGEYEVDSADNRDKFEKFLSSKEYDIVLSDFNILGFDGLQVLDAVKAKNPELPVIIVTGTGSEEIAIEAMKKGAADYVIKSVKHIMGLSPTIKAVLEHKALEKKHREALILLKENEQLFKSLIEEAPVGVFQTNAQGKTTYVNPQWCNITGLACNDAIGNGWFKSVHPDDQAWLLEEWNNAVANGLSSIVEYRFLLHDGSVIWVSGRAVPQRDENGTVKGYIGTATDISKRKIAEEKLKDSELKFRSLIESAPVGIIISDRMQRTQFVNKKFVELTGYTKDTIPSVEEWWLLAYPDEEYRKTLMKDWVVEAERAMSTGSSIDPRECKVTCNDGTVKFLDIGFVSVGELNIVSFVDITDRKKTELELRKSKEFTYSIIENLPMGLAVNTVEPVVKFEFMNKKFAKFYEVDEEQLTTPDAFWDVVYEDLEFREEIKKRVLFDMESGDPERMKWFDIPIKKGGKIVRYISARNIPLPEKGLTISTVWDVTERKLANLELIKLKESLEEKVHEQTMILRKQVQELEEFKEITINREFRIRELKDELESLKKQLP